MSAVPEPAILLQSEPTINHYFATFNAGCFQQTAQLFAEDGLLLPPFEAPIIGSNAIRAYLIQEAEGMQTIPKEMAIEPSDAEHKHVIVRGTVTTAIFKVNAAWMFQLNSQQQITRVRVKLLAALQDLMSLRPPSQS